MDKEKVKAFAHKATSDMAGVMAAGGSYIGIKTGLFQTMAGQGPMRLTEAFTILNSCRLRA